MRAAFVGSDARPFHVFRLLPFLGSLLLMLWALAATLRASRARQLGPFGWALLAALVANVVLMGSAAKQVFGHYVTNLYPFVIVAWAVLVRRLEEDRSPRASARRMLARVLVAAFCVGGVAATLEVSRRVDGKIGLVVRRRALAVIIDDARAQGPDAREPVRLDFHLRSSHYDWHVFATRALKVPITFDKRSRQRRYAPTPLDRHNRPPPAAAGAPVDVGYALLRRLP